MPLIMTIVEHNLKHLLLEDIIKLAEIFASELPWLKMGFNGNK
ncbi:hypothetical protein [Dapis sp. BLCC M126]